MAEKWREMTHIEDYEFDPDARYDGSIYSEQWEEIFDQLYQRAETTEEYLDNNWEDPVSTRNAYARRMEKNGNKYIVLKYYDGMYVLYEIKDSSEIDESRSVTAQVIAKLDAGVSVRQAISEATQGKSGASLKEVNKLFEDVAGMDEEACNQLIADLDKWTGGSGKGGWEYKTTENNGTYVVEMKKNPIVDVDGIIKLDLNNKVLNGEVYLKAVDEYVAASGPESFAGLKSVLRDILSQVEMILSDAQDESNADANADIYGY